MFGGIGDEDGGALGHFTRAVNEVNLKLNKHAAALGVQSQDVEELAVVRGLDPSKLRGSGSA